MQTSRYRLEVDVGGTFTDLVMLDEASGRIRALKVSSTPRDPSEAVLGAVLSARGRFDLELARVAQFTHATTGCSNTVLEGRGARTGLLVTEGRHVPGRRTVGVMPTRCSVRRGRARGGKSDEYEPRPHACRPKESVVMTSHRKGPGGNGGAARCVAPWFVVNAAALTLVGAAALCNAADPYPGRPIRIINTTAAGGPAEMVARIVGQKLTEAWGQQAVVDSRPGAGGIIGAEIAARATPDGYTLLLGSGATMVFAPLLQPAIQYDPLKDFAQVSMVVLSPFLLVTHPSIGVKGVSGLIALAKAKPNFINFGMLGIGSTSHLGIELLKIHTGIVVQQIAYKGGAPAATALVGGEIHALFNSLASALPHVKAGRLTLLATAGPRRSPLIPDTPTVAETYPGVEVVTWYSMLAPAKTPRDIVLKINAEIGRALADRQVADRLVSQGHEPRPSTPEQMAEYMRSEIDKWGKIIKSAGVKK